MRALALLLVASVALVIAAPARAEPDPDGGAPDAGPVITPPTLLADSPARYPPEAAATGLSGDVALRITLDADGVVVRAELEHGVDPLLDAAALEAAMSLSFSPAQVDGVASPATLGYVYRFTPPPPPPPKPRAILEGELVLRGRNARLAGVAVIAHRPGTTDDLQALSDADGHFTFELEPGDWELVVSGVELERFAKTEHLEKDQRLSVRYFVSGVRGRYETVVVGERERVEVSRTDLRAEELRSVPGTLGGDPFRAVLMLPGVAEPASGVAYPVVRGAAPASTGWYLDGVRLPHLFHFFLLSAVVQPQFIEGMEFYPSAYPAEFGRFTGGIVSASTTQGRTDRTHGSVSVDLINSGGYLETPLGLGGEQLSVAAAARVSYIGLGLRVAQALQLVDPGGFAEYWDYQARVEWKPTGSRGTWRLFAFGSHDAAGTDTQINNRYDALDDTFHRLDLRWRGPVGRLEGEAAATLGYDRLGGGDQLQARTLLAATRAVLALHAGRLTLRAGMDGEADFIHVFEKSGFGLGSITGSSINVLDDDLRGQNVGGFVEAQLALWRFLFVPGVRADLYAASDTQLGAVEPRMAIRFEASETTTLKVGGGLYHQAPTAFIELPTISVVALEEGLQTAVHAVAGVEQKLPPLGLDVEASVYWSNKVSLRELEIDDPDLIAMQHDQCHNDSSFPCKIDPFRERTGKSYGFELLVRRKLTERLFGWVAYTLSRTTSQSLELPISAYNQPGVGVEYPEIFDQTHIVNAVLSYDLPRRWRVGVGLHANTGKPYDSKTLIAVRPDHFYYNCSPNHVPAPTAQDPTRTTTTFCWSPDLPRTDRLPAFFRIDARVEKSWVLDRYTLTAYLDVLNASLRSEVVARNFTFNDQGAPTSEDVSIPLVVPMIGLRADF